MLLTYVMNESVYVIICMSKWAFYRKFQEIWVLYSVQFVHCRMCCLSVKVSKVLNELECPDVCMMYYFEKYFNPCNLTEFW